MVGATSRIPHRGVSAWWRHPQCTYYSDPVHPFILHVLLFHAIPVCLFYDWLFSVTDIDITVTGYMSCWYAMYGMPQILFPFPVIVFGAINRAHVTLSCYMYHILYLFLIYCIVKDNKDNLGMGETWRLTRSCRVDVWIHCLSHCRGRGSAGYRLL